MSKVVLEVPTLWADHHVLKVRDALVNLEGVNDVYVSSAWKQVLVAYDDSKTDQSAVEKALADAGLAICAVTRNGERWTCGRLRPIAPTWRCRVSSDGIKRV